MSLTEPIACYPADPPIHDTGDTSAASHVTWLRQVRFTLNMIHFVTEVMWPGDGVIAFAASGSPPIPTDSLKTEAQGTPDMTFNVLRGGAKVNEIIFYNDEDWTSAEQTAPVSNPRIDIVQVNPTTQAITVKTGSEAASPSAPTADTGALEIAQIYHRVGSTSIQDSDDSTNSYITDTRTYCNA